MPLAASRRAALETVADLARRFPGRAVWIGVDGLGASGKSTFAAEVAAAVPRAVVVNTDDMHGAGVEEWDWARLQRQVVVPLLAGRGARYRVWHWGEAAPGEWRDIAPRAVVIVEGVSATRRELVVPWDLTIWVDAPETVRRCRAENRDGPQIRELWERHWWPSEQRYLTRERPAERVDLVVSGVESSS